MVKHGDKGKKQHWKLAHANFSSKQRNWKIIALSWFCLISQWVNSNLCFFLRENGLLAFT